MLRANGARRCGTIAGDADDLRLAADAELTVGLCAAGSDPPPCANCAWQPACSALKLACSRFRYWAAVGRNDVHLSCEPNRRGYDSVFGRQATARAEIAVAASITRKRRAASR